MSKRKGSSIIGGLITIFLFLIIVSMTLNFLSYIWTSFVVKYWLIVVPLIIFIFYGVIKLGEQEKISKEKLIKEIQNNIYIIRNYATKYSYELNLGILDENNFNTLIELLRSKNINIRDEDKEDIKKLIFEELDEINYSLFKNKILYNKPKTLQNYLLNYLELKGENIDNISNLHRLINEKFENYIEEEIIIELNRLKKEIKLKTFEQNLSKNNREIYNINDIDLMTGYEFEDFLQHLFIKLGFSVENVQRSHDQGADLIINKFGEKTVVQAKRYSQNVGNNAIQEVTAAIRHYGADKGMVITTNKFTNAASELALSNNIELIDREKLEEKIKRAF